MDSTGHVQHVLNVKKQHAFGTKIFAPSLNLSVVCAKRCAFGGNTSAGAPYIPSPSDHFFPIKSL